MHEIKSPFLILMEEQSYLAQSLESAFEKQNVKVKIVTIAEASSIALFFDLILLPAHLP